MFPSYSSFTRRATTVASLACVVVLFGIVAAVPAKPVATEISSRSASAIEAHTPTLTVGPIKVSVVTSSTAIPVGGAFGLTVSTSASRTVDSLLVRVRLKHPGGQLIYQRTRTELDAPKGSSKFSFGRSTQDMNLRPGAYPVEVEVQLTDKGAKVGRTIGSTMFIYNPQLAKVPVVLAARISGQPLSDPTGRFIADPAQFTRARDDAARIASWVLARPTGHVTLAVSPLLLSEWRRTADGYELSSPEGIETVPATAPVPREYAATLALLASAEKTGRLELVSLGYSDPNLSELAARKLVSDVTPQYAEGLSATFASLESTPSTGTLPAGQCLPPSATRLLERQDVGYAVVRSVCVRAGDAAAAPGVYRVKKGDFTVIVADDRGAKTVAAADPRTFATAAFSRHVEEQSDRPFVTLVELGAGGSDVNSFLACAEAIDLQPWADNVTGREIAPRTERRTVTLIGSPPDKQSPEGFWAGVRSARRWADALVLAMGESAARPTAAQRNSMIAECSAWAGPQGDWALATRGLVFADTAERISRSVLEPISLSVTPVRLSGTTGEVPVTVKNSSQASLKVRLSAVPGNGVRLDGAKQTQVVNLRPQDNFFEIPIELQNILSGQLTITLTSGEVVLDRSVVSVRASYLDRLAMIAGVVVLLGILLAYIIRRVRIAESSSDAADGPSQYTEPSAPERPRRDR